MDPTLDQSEQRPAPTSGEGGRSTHVYVSPQITTAHVPPEFTLPQRPGTVQVSAAQPQQQTTRMVKSGPQINWGGVAKGVAIVAAVAVVAVVGAWLLADVLLPMIMSTSAGANIMGGLATGAHTVLDVSGGIAEVGWKSLLTVGEGFGAGFTGAAAGAAAPAPFLFVQNTMGSLFTWVGGLGAGLMALPLAMKQMAMINFIDPGTVSAVTTTTPASGAEIGAGALAAKKSVAIHQAPIQHIHGGDHAMTADQMVDEAAVQASNKAMKVVHHAAEDTQEYRQHRAAGLIARSREANQSWAERTGRSTAAPASIQSRKDSSFAQNLEADQAREAALPEGSRA